VKIDKNVEPAVREAFAASVAGERERFDAAVTRIGRSGDDFVNKALELVLAVNSAALSSIHEGKPPSDRQLQRLAEEFTNQENEWADIDAATTLTYLTSLADRKSPLEDLSLAEMFFTAFATGGWLLSAFLPDDGKWAAFLDEILDQLESQTST
jgi:hypothetical protein